MSISRVSQQQLFDREFGTPEGINYGKDVLPFLNYILKQHKGKTISQLNVTENKFKALIGKFKEIVDGSEFTPQQKQTLSPLKTTKDPEDFYKYLTRVSPETHPVRMIEAMNEAPATIAAAAADDHAKTPQVGTVGRLYNYQKYNLAFPDKQVNQKTFDETIKPYLQQVYAWVKENHERMASDWQMVRFENALKEKQFYEFVASYEQKFKEREELEITYRAWAFRQIVREGFAQLGASPAFVNAINVDGFWQSVFFPRLKQISENLKGLGVNMNEQMNVYEAVLGVLNKDALQDDFMKIWRVDNDHFLDWVKEHPREDMRDPMWVDAPGDGGSPPRGGRPNLSLIDDDDDTSSPDEFAADEAAGAGDAEGQTQAAPGGGDPEGDAGAGLALAPHPPDPSEAHLTWSHKNYNIFNQDRTAPVKDWRHNKDNFATVIRKPQGVIPQRIQILGYN